MTEKHKFPSTSMAVSPVKYANKGKYFYLVDKNDPYYRVKLGVWAYFFLIIFEGALRKWVFPGLSGPLLIIRDPLALWLIFLCWKKGLLPSTLYLGVMVMVGVVGVYTALFLGHGSIAVAIYGARILLFHFPFMFVIGRIFDQKDVIRLGEITLWLAMPMAVLITLQFYSPQSAWVNRGVGGDMEGAGFSGALGYFRPPGTFSFTNGTTLFFSFLACFIIYFWLTPYKSKILLIGATTALILAIPLSISRSLLFQVVISLIFALIAVSRKPKYMGRMILALAGGLLFLSILQNTDYFQTATLVFTHRFELANKSEGGVDSVFLDRFLGGMIGAIKSGNDTPFFGYGLGMGTNAGSFLLSGERKFLIAEGEWGRLIGEMGLLMGLVVIFVRLGVCAELTIASYKRLTKGEILPWLLLSFGLLTIAQSQWAQPTALGFSTLVGGLIIASFRKPSGDLMTK